MTDETNAEATETAALDLEAMSLDELKSLRKTVEAAIVSFEERSRQAALEAAAAAAAEHGFNITELMSAKAVATKGKTKGTPKFQNPKDPAQTWTGRGRKPNWFEEALEAGITEDQMLIGGKAAA